MNVHHGNIKDAPYYLTRYFRSQVVAWMIKHRQMIMANKGVTLMANYDLDEETDQYKGPLSYKQYLRHVLQHQFWGDEVILYMISCMWNLRITILNSRMLEEYRIQHSFPLSDADIGLVYNCSTHYSAAGELLVAMVVVLLIFMWENWSCCWSPYMVTYVVTLVHCLGICLVNLPVTLHFSACWWRPWEVCPRMLKAVC